MAAYTFEKILQDGINQKIIPAKTQQARDWYRSEAEKYRLSTIRLLKADNSRLQTQLNIGHMYLFNYDPKHKATLPYYDKFPLIFPISPMPKGGMLGINMHYLPLPERAGLMDALYHTRTNSKYDETTRMRISYEILKGASKFKAFKPCVKHYLPNHFKTQFFWIDPKEWDIALFLPLERFAKAGKAKAWEDSRKMIR